MLSQIKSRFEDYFFRKEVPYGLAVMRMTLPLVLLEEVLLRWKYAVDLYSTDGMPFTLWNNFGYPDMFPPMSGFWAACFLSIHAFLLITSVLGFYTSFSLFGACCLHTYFAITDAPTSITKFSVIATHALFLLSLSGCGKIWSLDYWIAATRGQRNGVLSERPDWALAPVWPRRLLLLMIGVVYLGAAITKLHMPTFMNGEALIYWMMANPNFRHFLGDWLSQNPGLLILSVHFTVLWEAIFLFVCWSRFPRVVVMILGLTFHLMAAFTLGEVIFLGIMTSLYFGVLDEYEFGVLCRFFAPIRRLFARTTINRNPDVSRTAKDHLVRWVNPQLKMAGMTLLIMIVGFGGGWLNLSLDLYGQQRPEGMYELPEIPREEVERLFKPMEPIREVDKFLAVDVGSLIVGNRLANRKKHFEYGEMMICEISLNPPHEDMWVECQLLGPDKKLFDREGKIVPREVLYSQFNYKMSPALEPGEYTIRIRCRGQEICSRRFNLGNVASAAKPSLLPTDDDQSLPPEQGTQLSVDDDMPPAQTAEPVSGDDTPVTHSNDIESP